MSAPSISTTALPDIIGQDWQPARVFTTVFTPPDAAGDQRRADSGANLLWTFRLSFQFLTVDQASVYLAAWLMTGGAWKPINFFEWFAGSYTAVYVAKGDGFATVFTLPWKGAPVATSTSVTVNGSGTGVTYSNGTGADGEDQITFASAPALNAVIRATASTVRRRRGVRITSFRLSAKRGGSGLYVVEATLLERTTGDNA